MSKILNSISITWVMLSYDDLNIQERANFYLWTENDVLQYIGKSNQDKTKNEIDQNLREFQIKNRNELTFYYGYFSHSTFKRHTEKLILSIECLLIATNQPILNSHCKKTYNLSIHHNQLIVRNKGCNLLNKTSKVDNILLH
jgi:hypothetical protein